MRIPVFGRLVGEGEEDILQGGVLGVAAVGRGHVHRVDAVVGHEGLVGGVASRHVERVCERVGPVLRPGAHGNQFGVGKELEVGGDGVRDVAGAENAPANWHVGPLMDG